MKDIMKKYLDNSPDCDTIILELQGSYDLAHMIECADLDDYMNKEYEIKRGMYDPNDEYNDLSVRSLFDLVREIWDAAYNHGYQDAQVDCGLTLTEQEE